MGAWLTPELEEALRQGYVIQYAYEVWHFPRKSNELFTAYIDTFLKIKQEASEWPDWTANDPDKQQQYVNNYKDKEGIELDPVVEVWPR